MTASRHESYSTIGVFRALQLGDMLCAVPSLRALRERWPHAKVTLIGLPWQRELLARFPEYVDDLVVFPGYPGLPEQAYDGRRLAEFLDEMNARSFDLLLQMHGNGTVVNPVIALCGARETAGFCSDNAYCPDPDRYIDYPEDQHEIERLLSLMRHIGLETEHSLEFPIREDERLEFYRLANRYRLNVNMFACIHPGARDPARRWPVANFIRVARHLLANGVPVVVTGTRAEAKIGEEISAATGRRVVNLVGRTSLGTLAALIDNARLLVCNDTGVSHIAAARQTPSVVIFSASDPARWAPIERAYHFIVPPDRNADLPYVMALTEAALTVRDEKQAL